MIHLELTDNQAHFLKKQLNGVIEDSRLGRMKPDIDASRKLDYAVEIRTQLTIKLAAWNYPTR